MSAPTPRWKWVQVSNFEHPKHPEWDLIQWDLEDELVFGPRRVSKPVFPVQDPPHEWRYLFSKDAPGLQHLPACVVLFRIVSEPTPTQPGVIEGWCAWSDDDMQETLMSVVRMHRR